MSAMDDLKAAVAAETSATQSAVTLLNGLAQQLKDALATNNSAAIEEVANQIIANTNALAAAVTANTPTSPPPPPPPTGGSTGPTGPTGPAGGTDTTTGGAGGQDTGTGAQAGGAAA